MIAYFLKAILELLNKWNISKIHLNPILLINYQGKLFKDTE